MRRCVNVLLSITCEKRSRSATTTYAVTKQKCKMDKKVSTIQISTINVHVQPRQKLNVFSSIILEWSWIVVDCCLRQLGSDVTAEDGAIGVLHLTTFSSVFQHNDHRNMEYQCRQVSALQDVWKSNFLTMILTFESLRQTPNLLRK